MRQRIASLEAALADVRQRLRNGSRAILAAGAATDSSKSGFDLALWGFGAEPEADLDAAIACVGGLPATVMMGHQHRAESFAGAPRNRWSVLESSCARPAHYWNQAMAATTQDVVVFLAAGLEVGAEDVRRLAEAARCDGVATSCPRVIRGDGTSMGYSEQGILEIRAAPFSSDVASALVPFASPEVFAIARKAYEAVGPFDQDLTTGLALAEWTMRAASQSLRVVGVASADAREVTPRPAAPVANAESDRLVVLARHRPHQFMVAALASEALWQGDADAVATTLRAAIQRLPGAHEFPAAVDILVHQAQCVASYKRVSMAVRQRAVALCNELQLPADLAASDAALPSLVDRAVSSVVVLRQQSASAARAVQDAEQARRDLEQATSRHAAIERELKDGMLARSSTIDALRHELLERERAIGSLKEDLGRRVGESQRLVEQLEEHRKAVLELREQAALDRAERERLVGVDAKRVAAEEQLARFREEMSARLRTAIEAGSGKVEASRQESERLRLRIESLEQSVADATRRAETAERGLAASIARGEEAEAVSRAAGARALGLEARIRSADERLTELEAALDAEKAAVAQGSALAEARASRQAEAIREIEERLAAANAGASRLEGELEERGARNAELDRKRAQIEELAASLRKELEAARHRSREEAARADASERTLREREEWICLLLHEVCQRRVMPRDLLPHETEFLARNAKPQQP